MEDKYQETCTWTHYKGLLKTKHKNKILKAVRGGKRTYNIQVNSNKNVCLVFIRNSGSQKRIEMSLKCKWGENVQNSIPREKLLKN